MDKKAFLAQLRSQLSGLPQNDIEDRLIFYSEMIDDIMEEGITEEEAVSRLGEVEDIATSIINEIPLTKLVKERIKSKSKPQTKNVLLIALGSPVWLPLLISAFAVIIALYVSFWAVIVSLWSVFASFAACAFSGSILGFIYMFSENFLTGLAVIGASMVLAGLAILMFYACKAVTKGAIILTKKMWLGTKKMFMKKEAI